ncbi:hypothetical protein ACF09L_32525 [Streptomyces sp. NPDC014779]|uniref:hypothetical protein n=1 Tax=Streptomyces sp. NPDC014779 TaxID=3364911 RepID=UPI0036FA01BE
MTAPAAPAGAMLPECRFEMHRWCKPGEVRTCYGDVVPGLGRRCACPCHKPATKEKRRA